MCWGPKDKGTQQEDVVLEATSILQGKVSEDPMGLPMATGQDPIQKYTLFEGQ